MRLKAFFKKVLGCIPLSDCRNVVFGFFSQTPFFVLKTGKNPQWNKSQCCVNIEENCSYLLATQNRRKDGWLMGIYLNPGNNKFKRAVNSDIYVDKTVFIPNEEIRSEYVSAIAVSDWGEVSKALKNSADTLQAIWQGREEQVAEGIRQAHFETSHLQYNDENALSYTISLALYAARNFYTVHQELSGGKGFADIVYVPRKRFLDKPALVVELKWDKNAEGAIQQIKEKEYCRSLEEYKGNLLLVGINYDKKTQVHTCKIEQYRKEESI